jgi:unsaturated chondroitin disaccharide hydrolase
MPHRSRARRLIGGGLALLAATCLLAAPSVALADDPFDDMVRDDVRVVQEKLALTSRALPETSYPNYTDASGAWVTARPRDWTSGFFPGSLWLQYQQTGDPSWRAEAERWQAGVEDQKNNTAHHDVGFQIFNSFGNAYRLTGDEAYRQVVLTAAGSLATRYNPTVGAILSWNSPHPDYRVIVDNMMNLELLFWAAKHGGDPSWHDIAVSHALKTRQHHVRLDGGTYHVVTFNAETGDVTRHTTHQGYHDESTWAVARRGRSTASPWPTARPAILAFSRPRA